MDMIIYIKCMVGGKLERIHRCAHVTPEHNNQSATPNLSQTCHMENLTINWPAIFTLFQAAFQHFGHVQRLGRNLGMRLL